MCVCDRANKIENEENREGVSNTHTDTNTQAAGGITSNTHTLTHTHKAPDNIWCGGKGNRLHTSADPLQILTGVCVCVRMCVCV